MNYRINFIAKFLDFYKLLHLNIEVYNDEIIFEFLYNQATSVIIYIGSSGSGDLFLNIFTWRKPIINQINYCIACIFQAGDESLSIDFPLKNMETLIE